MISWLFKKIYKIWGWTVTGTIPNHMKKKIYITIPHTSNWDFPIGILLKYGFGMDVQFLAKKSLFNPPFGWVFKKLGGIPVDRSKNNNFVDSTVDTLNKYDKISISIAPEGTRKAVSTIKSGFYWISVKSGIPLIFVKFDWGTKNVDFSGPFIPSGDYDKDLEIIKTHFEGVIGKIPTNGWLQNKDQ